MKPDRVESVDEVVNDTDDLKTRVEELHDEAEPDERPAFDRLNSALDEATAATDELEDRND